VVISMKRGQKSRGAIIETRRVAIHTRDPKVLGVGDHLGRDRGSTDQITLLVLACSHRAGLKGLKGSQRKVGTRGTNHMT